MRAGPPVVAHPSTPLSLDRLPKPSCVVVLVTAVQSCRRSFGHISIALVVLRRWGEVYEPVIEVLRPHRVIEGVANVRVVDPRACGRLPQS